MKASIRNGYLETCKHWEYCLENRKEMQLQKVMMAFVHLSVCYLFYDVVRGFGYCTHVEHKYEQVYVPPKPRIMNANRAIIWR
jgi:hypothetical protein